jgi:RNA polymerase sigma-70 factor (ECF subfamily)
MNVVDGYAHKEIAESLGISESTSRSQFFKARKLLQKKINQDYEQSGT